MEKHLKFSVVLPLKQMTLRRVAFLQLSHPDIFSSIFKVLPVGYQGFHHNKRRWTGIENKIKKKMLKLQLPDTLMEEVTDLVRPVGWQIRRFSIVNHLCNEACPLTSSLPDASYMYFTSAGVISYRKTAELLARCDAIRAQQRYILASLNCLEDNIRHLWEHNKDDIFTGIPSRLNLKTFWNLLMRGELFKLDQWLKTLNSFATSINQWGFEYSAWSGNKVATEYFFVKLTEQERDESVIRCVEGLLTFEYISNFRNEGISEVCCHLMSLLSPSEQMAIVKKRPLDVLFCFLDFPWQDLFLENAGLIWTEIPRDDYDKLLSMMENRLAMSDHHFHNKFRELLAHSPLEFRHFFISPEAGEYNASNFLIKFVSSKDVESVKILFSIVDPADRYKVFQEEVISCLYRAFLSQKDMLKVCLEEAKLSKEDMERLKEACMDILGRNGSSQEKKSHKKGKNVNFFLNFLDRANKEINGLKRKLDNDCEGSGKHLCK